MMFLITMWLDVVCLPNLVVTCDVCWAAAQDLVAIQISRGRPSPIVTRGYDVVLLSEHGTFMLWQFPKSGNHIQPKTELKLRHNLFKQPETQRICKAMSF